MRTSVNISARGAVRAATKGTASRASNAVTAPARRSCNAIVPTQVAAPSTESREYPPTEYTR